jgi:hypothetical protein
MAEITPEIAVADQRINSPDSLRFVRWLVALAIVMSAVVVYHSFWRTSEGLWYAPAHDRNGHYQRSQNIAFALLHGSFSDFVTEVHAATVWPPLHPLVTGPILAVGGIDYRLAVLSSLAAWVATCWLAFALAVRLAPRCKVVAGLVAATFTLASPAYRAYSVDIMIESMGAALTLAVLYFYVTAFDELSARRGRWLGVSLFALLVTKSNYWTLIAAGIAPAALYRYRAPLISWLMSTLRPHRVMSWITAQVRHPMTYVLLPAFGLAGYVRFVGPISFEIAGRHIGIQTLNFPSELCYSLLLIRILPWWRRNRREASERLPVPLRQMLGWFGYPLAVWWLWPNRLGAFLDSVGRTEHGRVADYSPWFGSLPYYWGVLAGEYHANLICLIVAVAFIAVAILTWRQWDRGGAAVISYLIVAAMLTNYHPANRARFLFTWLAAGWVVAGVGAAWLIDRLSRQFAGLRPALSGGLVAIVACLHGPALWRPGHAEEGGPRADLPSLLPVVDALIPELQAAHRPGLLCSPPLELVFDWRLAEVRGEPRRMLTPPREDFIPTNSSRLGDWLRHCGSDLLLLVDAPPPVNAPPTAGFDATLLRSRLASDEWYQLAFQRRFADCHGLTVEVWRPRLVDSPVPNERAAANSGDRASRR